MELEWHGHSCFELRGQKSLVFDPHDGKSIGIPPPATSADLVFVSHDHFDHNAVRSIRGDPRIISDTLMGEIDGLLVKTFVLPHDNVGGEKRGMVRAYHVEMAGVSFLHLGDVGVPPPQRIVEEERNVSMLFLPVGGVFTIGPEEAVAWMEAIKPRVAIPMHYRVGGLSLSIKPVEEFLSIAGDKVLKVGKAVSFHEEDLPQRREIWVFSL